MLMKTRQQVTFAYIFQPITELKIIMDNDDGHAMLFSVAII